MHYIKSSINHNSMLYWFNRISNLDIPMPHSIFCDLDDSVGIKNAAESMGYPCFLRTDLCSGKHDWKQSCYLADSISIQQHMDKVLEANVRWQMLGIEPQAFVIREFLNLDTAFTAFCGDMPVNRERRYFVKDGHVECSHPYWPSSAFNNHPARMAHAADWDSQLAILNNRDNTEACLSDYAALVGSELGGYWSIDFARDVHGKWWLLDAALGDNSYHYPHTPTITGVR